MIVTTFSFLHMYTYVYIICYVTYNILKKEKKKTYLSPSSLSVVKGEKVTKKNKNKNNGGEMSVFLGSTVSYCVCVFFFLSFPSLTWSD